MPSQTALFALLLLPLAAAGCKKQETSLPVQPNIESAHSRPASAKKESRIVVPPAVAGKWKAVKIAVVDKAEVSERIYTIPIGGSQKISSTGLTVAVETFLPAFIMEGATLTSSSNEPTNPGAKVMITENGVVIFKGWLFSKYPNTHEFMNPKYGFNLVGMVPTGH